MAFNYDRTEASDPISIDDKLLALMREQGGNPGMAKLPGAPMIVANPLYPDEAASAPLPPKRPASAGQGGGRSAGGQAPLPPRRPVEEGGDEGNGGFSGGAKYAGLTQPGGTQAPTPPPRPGQEGGTQTAEEGNPYTLPAAVGGGTGLLMALLAARAMRGQKGEVPQQVMPEEAGGPAKPKALPAPQEKLALPAPEEQKLLPKPETIYAGDESGSPKQIEHIAPEPEGELIKPEEFKKPAGPAVAEEVPEGEEKPAPKAKRSRSSKKAVGDAKAEKMVLPNSGIEADKAGINEALSKLLAASDQIQGLVRGGGARPRVPKIGR